MSFGDGPEDQIALATLGINTEVSYTYSLSSTAASNTVVLTPGYEVWPVVYDEAVEYTGTTKEYDAGGYVGTRNYDDIVPNGYAGVECSDPIWVGDGPDPGNPYP